MRRIGVLAQGAANDPEIAARLTAFVQGLQEMGWSVGRNTRIEYRWGAADNNLIRRYAAELVALSPDVILAAGGGVMQALMDATRTIPIVFDMLDPVAGGMVESLARPGGNATGFTQFEFAMSGKWLELLKQIAPRVTRVVVLRDPRQTASMAQFSAIQAVAPSLGVELTPMDVRNPSAMERGIDTFARGHDGGMILTQSPLSDLNRDLIIMLAAKNKSSRERNRSFSLVSRRSRGRIANSSASSARARGITACDSRESSKPNLQGSRPATARSRQIRLLKRAQSSKPFNSF